MSIFELQSIISNLQEHEGQSRYLITGFEVMLFIGGSESKGYVNYGGLMKVCRTCQQSQNTLNHLLTHCARSPLILITTRYVAVVSYSNIDGIYLLNYYILTTKQC